MDQVKEAVKLLIEAGKVILPDVLPLLKTSADPVKLVSRVLDNEPNEEHISVQLLKKYYEGIPSSPQKSLKVNNKRDHKEQASTQSSLLSRLMQEPNQATKPKIKARTISKPVQVTNNGTIIQTSLDDLTGLHNYETNFNVIRDPQLSQNLTGTIEDILGYFQNRYKKLSRMFRDRSDIQELIPMKNLKQNHTHVSIIGMVTEKLFPSKDSGKLILEDPSSNKSLEVIINNDSVLVEQATQLMNDTVVCVSGSMRNGAFFCQDINLPDIPRNRELAKADIPVHVAFLSDIHIGSKNFLEEPFEKVVQFLNGEWGNKKAQQLGLQTKYLLLSGDSVDGVGIYPNQLEDLSVESISEQYDILAGYLEQVPEDVQIVIIPGNHDMVRAAEPQPRIPADYVPQLEGMQNIHLLPNPAQVSLHGVQTLMYHCTSLPDIMNHIPGLPIDKPVDVMKHMLKARHLAPLWGDKTQIAAEPEDHLVIDPIPDIFHGGHVHINGEGSYRGVQIVNSGTMQRQTSYQKSLNIIPTPGQVTIVNLKDRKMSRVDFLSS